MTKYIVLNGPARSGKDTIGQAIHAYLVMHSHKSIREKFAGPIKDAVAGFLGLTHAERLLYFEQPYVKDKKLKRFMGMSPRDVLISFSEDWVKPLFGKESFGKLLLQRTSHLTDFIVVTDCGFNEELEPFDKADVAVVRLHREGCSFDGDSRSYIDRDDVLVIDVKNNAEPETVAKAILWKLRKEVFINVNVEE